MYDPSLTSFVQIREPNRRSNDDLVPDIPSHRRRQLVVVEMGGNGAIEREFEDEVKTLVVNAAAEESGYIRMPNVADGTQLG